MPPKQKQKQSQNVRVTVNLAEKKKPRKKRGRYRRMKEPQADTSRLAAQQFPRVQVIRYEYPVSGQPQAPPIQVVREPHAAPAAVGMNQNAFGTRDPGPPIPDRSTSVARIPAIPERNASAPRIPAIPERNALSRPRLPPSPPPIRLQRAPSTDIPPELKRAASDSLSRLPRWGNEVSASDSLITFRGSPPGLNRVVTDSLSRFPTSSNSRTNPQSPLGETREQARDRAIAAVGNMPTPSLFSLVMRQSERKKNQEN